MLLLWYCSINHNGLTGSWHIQRHQEQQQKNTHINISPSLSSPHHHQQQQYFPILNAFGCKFVGREKIKDGQRKNFVCWLSVSLALLAWQTLKCMQYKNIKKKSHFSYIYMQHGFGCNKKEFKIRAKNILYTIDLQF